MKLQEWINNNQPADNMIWKKSFWNQVMFVHDTLIRAFDTIDSDEFMLLKQSFKVISAHKSKSILLPVYYVDWKDVKLTFRNNFFDWKISVNSKHPINNIDQFELFLPNNPINPIYCEGFQEDWVYGPYAENQSKFTISINDNYEFFCFIKLLYLSID